MTRDDIVSRTRYRKEIKETINGMDSRDIAVEMMVDQRLARDELKELKEPILKLQKGCHVLNTGILSHDNNHSKVKLALADKRIQAGLAAFGMLITAILTYLGTTGVG